MFEPPPPAGGFFCYLSLFMRKKNGMKKRTKSRWVIKVGSNMVSTGGPILLRSWMEQVVKLRRDYNIEIIWGSSGAISSAVNRKDFKKKKSVWSVSEKQALSAMGQPILMDLYNLSLQATGLMG